jgi:hypothetical protein
MGAALTYARRYALFTLVGIAGEDDLDAPDLMAPTLATSLSKTPKPNSKTDGNSGNHRPAAGAANRGGQSELSAALSASLRDELLREIESLKTGELPPPYPAIIHAVFDRANSDGHELRGAAQTRASGTVGDGSRSDSPNLKFARFFLRVANLPNFALDRLSRYEATLWRQVPRILITLDALESPKATRKVTPLSLWRLSGFNV